MQFYVGDYVQVDGNSYGQVLGIRNDYVLVRLQNHCLAYKLSQLKPARYTYDYSTKFTHSGKV